MRKWRLTLGLAVAVVALAVIAYTVQTAARGQRSTWTSNFYLPNLWLAPDHPALNNVFVRQEITATINGLEQKDGNMYQLTLRGSRPPFATSTLEVNFPNQSFLYYIATLDDEVALVDRSEFLRQSKQFVNINLKLDTSLSGAKELNSAFLVKLQEDEPILD